MTFDDIYSEPKKDKYKSYVGKYFKSNKANIIIINHEKIVFSVLFIMAIKKLNVYHRYDFLSYLVIIFAIIQEHIQESKITQ